MLGHRSQDFYLVTTVEFMAQWDKFMVDLCTDTVATEEGVDLESKIECRTTCRHCLNLTLWCKYKDFRGKEVEFDSI